MNRSRFRQVFCNGRDLKRQDRSQHYREGGKAAPLPNLAVIVPPISVGFHIGYSQAMNVLGMWIYIPALVVLGLALASYAYAKKKSEKPTPRFGVAAILALVGVLALAFPSLVALSLKDTGWSLNRGILSVNTGSGTFNLVARNIHTKWVSSTGPWGLSERLNGTGAREYYAGHFLLNNNHRAMVFEYGHGPILAVFGSSHQIILLSSPGIKSLPGALVSQAQNSVTPASLPRSEPLYGLYFSIGIGVAAVTMQGLMSRHFSSRLPQRVAIHFGFSGQPNGYGSKKTSLWLGPGISLALGILGVVLNLPGTSNPGAAGIFAFIELVMLLVFWWMFRMNLNLKTRGE